MDAALPLWHARRDSGCPAFFSAGGFNQSGPEADGLLLSVSVPYACTDPLCTGEDLLPEEVLSRSNRGVPPGLLPVGLHRAADPHREHQHSDRAGADGFWGSSGGPLHPGFVFLPGVPQRAGAPAVPPHLPLRRALGEPQWSVSPSLTWTPGLRPVLVFRDARFSGRGALHVSVRPGGEIRRDS